MSAAMLIVSIGLLILGGRLLAMLWPRHGQDRYWVGLAGVFLQVGIISMATSALHAFEAAWVLAAQLLLVGVLGALSLRRGPRRSATPPSPLSSGLRELRTDWVAVLFALVVVAFLFTSGISQALTPIKGIDERNYHGPVLLYWLQNHSTFPFPTHNLRQTLFPPGTELITVWPLLFVKQEWLCRMVFWLCLPLGAAGVWSVCRALGLSVRVALGAVALWCSTPGVTAYAESLKSDAWVAVFLLGCAYWLCSPRPAAERPGVRFLLAAVFLALAANCKITSLGALPVFVVIAMFGCRGWRARVRAMLGTSAGLLTGIALSGLGVVLVYGAVEFGNPLGPREFRLHTQTEPGWTAHATQLVRVPFFLAELPEAWSEPMRKAVEETGVSLSRAAGAYRLLRDEEKWTYPGRFEYHVAWVANAYSLGGVVWLPMLGVAGVWCLRRQLLAGRPIAGVAVPAALSGCLLLAIAWSVRWMGGGPNRFWLGAYALSVPVTAAFIARWARSPLVAALVCIGAVWAIYPSLRNLTSRASGTVEPKRPRSVLEPYEEVTRHLQPGARVLLIAGNTTREWGLFDPAHGFPNQVWSWAWSTPDAQGVTTMLDRVPITDIVLERDTVVGVNWGSSVPVAPIVRMLRSRPDLIEVPLTTPSMRLFKRPTAQDPFQESPG
jgi:hypothetical protein